MGTFGVGVGGLVGFGGSGLWVGGWCCDSVLGVCGVGWIASGCELVYGVVLYAGGVVWVGFGAGCDCCCFEFDYALVWVVDDCFDALMVFLMRIW